MRKVRGKKLDFGIGVNRDGKVEQVYVYQRTGVEEFDILYMEFVQTNWIVRAWQQKRNPDGTVLEESVSAWFFYSFSF